MSQRDSRGRFVGGSGAGADMSQLMAGLQQADQRIREAAMAALDVFGEHVIGESQQRTPVRTGFLQGSATTQPAQWVGGELVKQIGHNAEYAAAVHNRDDMNFRVGQREYLKTALERTTPQMAGFIGGRLGM